MCTNAKWAGQTTEGAFGSACKDEEGNKAPFDANERPDVLRVSKVLSKQNN